MSPADQQRVLDALVPEGTLCELFQATARASADRPALEADDDGRRLTWAQYAERVEEYARALAGLGVGHGDVVGLLLRNVPEFHVADVAILHLGAVPYSFYATDPPDRMAGFAAAAGISVLVTESAHLDRALALREATGITDVALVDAGAADDATPTIAALAATSDELDFAARWAAVRPDDVACLIYTSGSTGAPKGVELSHRAIRASVAQYAAAAPVAPHGRVVSYLPLAHIADRFGSHYKALGYGHAITSVVDAATLYDTIRAVRPTDFFAVPRVLEKVWDRVRDAIGDDPELVRVLEQRTAQAAEGGPAIAVDDRFAAARAAVGLDAVQWLTVGAAPSSRPVLEAMHAVGLPFADIWGMTEIIVCSMATGEPSAIGTIGRPLGDVEFRIEPDGELLARGSSAFNGYRGDPGRTAETRDADGWIHTGDLATERPDGLFAIVGRKKEIMINAAGKNLSPLTIEGTLKATSPLIDQVVAIADGRRYVTALIALDGPALRAFAQRRGLAGDFAALTREPDVLQAVADAVQRGNARLPRVEQVRSWAVVDREWTPGGDEVTGSMKLARTVIQRKYAAEIDALYAPA